MSTDLPHDQTERKGLPRFLNFSIIALIAITLLAIIMLFIDPIEERGGRLFSTFILFAGFVGLTAADTLKANSRSWYPPAALLSNTVFLAASILIIWLTSSNYFSIVFASISMMLTFLLILRLGILLSLLAMNSLDKEQSKRPVDKLEVYSSVSAAWLGNTAAVLFVGYMTLQEIINSKNIVKYDSFWDLYLKMSTVILIMAGLALSISLLLRWFFGAELRKTQQAELRVRQQKIQEENVALQNQAVKTSSAPAPSQELLPWPTFEDGTPYPALANNQPDFKTAEAQITLNQHKRAE